MADADRSRRRVRSLLSNYYGVGDKAAEPNEADVKNIDAAAFDANVYVQELIKDQSVANLISRDNHMVSEIKSLDSDMQMLVYENYNKFISATDTIRKMKEKVDTMEGSMTKLQSSMEKISECSVGINSNLSDHRVQIEELQGIRRFLKKLQFLSDLPSRLNYAIDMGSFGTAVKYVSASEKFLDAYHHKQTFSNIKREVDAAKRKMREKMKEKMAAEDVSMTEMSECVGHLLSLKEPEEAMRDHFIERRKNLLLKYVNDPQLAEAGGVDAYIIALNGMFLVEFTEYVKSYTSLFMKDSASADKSSPAHQQLAACAKELFEIYFTKVKERFRQRKPDEDPRSFIEALGRFSFGMQGAHQAFPHARLMDRGTEIIESTVRADVDDSFERLHKRVEATIIGMEASATAASGQENPASTATSLSSAVGIVAQQIVRDVESVLKNLESVVSTAEKALFGSDSGTFLALIYGHVRQFFDFLDRRMTEMASPSKDRPSVMATFILMLTRLSLEMEANMIVQISHVLSNSFPARGGEAGNTENHLSMLNLADTKSRCRNTTMELLLIYVKTQGQTLSHMLRKAVENTDWMKMNKPRAVRASTEMIVNEIQNMDTEIAQIFPDDPNVVASGASKVATDYRARRAASRHNAIEKDVQRLFQKKIRVFTNPETNRNSITTAVLKVMAKTYSECVRMLRFSTFGYQQMQVDLHYTQVACRGITMDDAILQSLFDEVITSCADGCNSPTGLDKEEIESCCQNTET